MDTRTVLVVSQFSEYVETFIDLAIQPVGIVELSPKQYNTKWLGRKKQCEAFCLKHGLAYANVFHANLEILGRVFEQWNTDLVITYSVPILPMSTLASVYHGGINIHHSYLPAYRGGNPLLWQVMDENETFGISVHVLTDRVDEGAVLGQVKIKRVSGSSKKQLVATSNRDYGVPLLRHVVADFIHGKLNPTPQPELSTTDKADHIHPTELLTVLAQKKVSLNGLWDVVCFFSYLPYDCMPEFGWQAWFRWEPSGIKQACTSEKCGDGFDSYQVIPVGFQLHLTHADGCVVCKPRWHTSTFLSRLLL